jgi:hypothetical protein
MARFKQKTAKEECESDLVQIRRQYTNPPSIQYKIGDRVRCGNLDKSIVDRIEDGGRLLYLRVNHDENYYGRLRPIEKYMWVQWQHVIPYVDYDVTPPSPQMSNRDGVLNFSQTSIESVLNHFYHAGLDLNPRYQRDIVWNTDDRLALLDSIFNNVDIGKFVFVRRSFTTDGPLYEILDGKQRFTTLMDYCESRFRWRGHLYHELCLRDQGHIDNYMVSQATLENPAQEQILQVFLRLNTTGRPLDPAHIERVRKMLEMHHND